MSTEWTQAVRGTQLLWLPIPAYSGLPILLWVMHARTWTFLLAIAVGVTLAILKMKGRTVPWILRRARMFLRKGLVRARTLWFLRRARNLDSFDLVNLKGE